MNSEGRSNAKDLLARLAIPETRTNEPLVFVAGGDEQCVARFFDCLREFFPMVFVPSAVCEEIDSDTLLAASELATGRGLCPFFAAGNLHPSRLGALGGTTAAVKLFWVADCSKGMPSRAAADRMTWLNSFLGTERYYLVDSSQDFYQQIFSLPFLPGQRR